MDTSESLSSNCYSCGKLLSSEIKRDFMGFRKRGCEFCGSYSYSPLTKRYRLIYLGLIVFIVIASGQSLLKYGSDNLTVGPIGLSITIFSAWALIQDYKLRNGARTIREVSLGKLFLASVLLGASISLLISPLFTTDFANSSTKDYAVPLVFGFVLISSTILIGGYYLVKRLKRSERSGDDSTNKKINEIEDNIKDLINRGYGDDVIAKEFKVSEELVQRLRNN